MDGIAENNNHLKNQTMNGEPTTQLGLQELLKPAQPSRLCDANEIFENLRWSQTSWFWGDNYLLQNEGNSRDLARHGRIIAKNIITQSVFDHL
jgi:hypothetical protein